MSRHLRPHRALCLPSQVVLRSALPRTAEIQRCYATHSDLGRGSSAKAGATRKSINILSDDGRVRWEDLSGGEKVARATQQSINFAVVLAGAILTGGVFYLLYLEVFSPNSKTWQFEKAVERIKDDSRCISLLGDRSEIKAYGESTWSKWARNRPIASTISKDGLGREHLQMNFHVEGPLNSGVAFVHMIKPQDRYEWEYVLLALDVKGHSRIYLEHHEERVAPKPVKIFGIQWR
ncbi:mitochondrial import inner membrane translocase subunit tim21 [Monascus purpureus]|uniref:Mitochondrial import inner membrane translocase subunit Tim21 n=1 Tax=Monascus purpureus TaxID=5098 RepID=A0A507QV53_MONPU|nr:mitochondrial import inner membrane translocase subunit tim21 [Monascus purpureus]BDD58117.1 mitochondrial import inner membrane translocase subunit tim21 [Monascus purpureus]